MASKTAPLLVLAGAGLLLLSTSKKKKKKTGIDVIRKGDEEDLDERDEDENIFDTDEDEEDEEEKKEIKKEEKTETIKDILEKYMSLDGRAGLGNLYLIKPGDTPLEICREALFGSREPVTDPVRRQAAIELLIRIDCGPWNQACYGVPLAKLGPGHANVDRYFTQKGVSWDPIYSDNLARILNGLKPTSEPGGYFALIWIPMIDIDRFDLEGIISTEGMNYPDTESGLGYNMIDPPPEILNLGFEMVSAQQVGCELPEGDFRQVIVANG